MLKFFVLYSEEDKRATTNVQNGSVFFFLFSFISGKKKTNKHKHFRRDSVRDKQEPSLGQMGPLPGTKWDPSLGQTGLSLFNSTVKTPFCPVVPGTGGGLSLGRLSRKGRQKNVYVFSVYWFFLLPLFSFRLFELKQ